jgi:hypothetical protein
MLGEVGDYDMIVFQMRHDVFPLEAARKEAVEEDDSDW